MTVRVVDVSGDHGEIGYQHAVAVLDLREQIGAMVERQVRQARPRLAEQADRRLGALQAVLERHSPATLAQLDGLGAGLGCDPADLLRWVAAGYVYAETESAQPGCGDEGCTTWAATGPVTGNGGPILVKNRDQPPESLPLQLVLRARPKHGVPWVAVTTAGAPGVHSSGMNAAGLAIADTHVPSRDLGPGLPRYSLMLHVLEEHETVDSALAYLASVPMQGTGNLVLADAHGTLATVECGYHTRAIVRRVGDAVVATNHFVSPALADAYIEAWPDAADHSRRRYAAVQAALAAAAGQVDSAFARVLMARHDGPVGSICVHRTPERASETISCAIFRPAERLLEIAHGLPCTSAYQTIPVVAE